jgi:CRISPR-associated endonuclease Csn1
MKKTILGLDLGTNSIGWALVDAENKKILGMGSRIIPYSDTEGDDFLKGSGESKNQSRTAARTARKLLDRYQLRRKYLFNFLKKYEMLPDNELISLSALELYSLRSRAANEKITLKELGRLFQLLNQKRGYKHASTDDSEDKKQRDFVATINSRFTNIKGKQTVGQFFYKELEEHISAQKYYRIKEQIFPREAYIVEFNQIWEQQAKHHSLLTDELKVEVRDRIIYYQRKLKSQKDLVSVCEFEGFITKTKEGKELFVGPKVAPRSSPLFQVAKIWESINNITIKRINPNVRKHEVFDISPFKKELFEYLNENVNLSETELFKILGIKKTEGFYSDKNSRKKGIQGNLTLTSIKKALDGYEQEEKLTAFPLSQIQGSHLDKSTGEIIDIVQIDKNIELQPLYVLWHVCYSIKDKQEKINALQKKFNLPINYATALAQIDFIKSGYGNKSNKALRKILPELMKGSVYSTAMELVGYNHSFSETKDEKLIKPLKDELKPLQKNALRQPIVEKILNQMINVVNAVIKEYGKPDEIRVELSRELKQSKEERNDYFNAMNQRTKQNEKIAERLEKDYKVRASRKNIEKWRLWHEVEGRCLYCNEAITVANFLNGVESDVEHIIPKSIFYDDSYANKTIAHTACNTGKLAKNAQTAFDYVRSKGDEKLDTYLTTINLLYKNDKADKAKTEESVNCLTGKISKSKFDRLQWRKEDIPQDFISRQINETRYIARKAVEILNTICRNVHSTTGNITSLLRRLWGWEDVLMNLSIEKYREQGLTEIKQYENNGHKYNKEIIPNWSKRDDHRHHAIDALAVACTQQGFIQRLNTLNAEHTRNEMLSDIKDEVYKEKLSLIEKHLVKHTPFNTSQVEEAVSSILVSFKAGKKVATISKRKATGKNLEKGVLVPRGALSEQSVYGKIKTLAKDFKKNELIKYPIKYLFENSDLIYKKNIKHLVKNRLYTHGFDVKKATASLKKDPIYLDDKKQIKLEWATCWSEEVVIKYPITSITSKDAVYIVDEKIKEKVIERLSQHGNKEKEAFKEVLWLDETKQIPIHSVRLYTALKSVEPVKKDQNGENIGFVLPKNNHHIAIYKNKEGELVEAPATFWHCVERKAFFLTHFTKEDRLNFQHNTVIINPKAVWDRLLQLPDDVVSQEFKEQLPNDEWEYVTSMQRNEMFVFGLTKDEIQKAIVERNNKIINRHLYRVQKLASNYYIFRFHCETKVDDKHNGVKNEIQSKQLGKMIGIHSLNAWKTRNPIKVSITNLGGIQLL